MQMRVGDSAHDAMRTEGETLPVKPFVHLLGNEDDETPREDSGRTRSQIDGTREQS